MQLLDHDGLKAKGLIFSKTHLWRLVRKGKFPKPVKVGEGRNAWLESEIDAYIQRKIAERDAPVAA